jgi:SAM-dependent methyltransferase
VRKSARASASFDKYYYYSESVQSPATDAAFLKNVYRELCRKDALVLREDFCGTFLLCEEWIKLSKKHQAYGLDLDTEPLNYGLKRLKSEPQDSKDRIHILKMNVMNPRAPQADIIVAMNFSYFIFKKREELLQYFKNAKATLKPGGVFIVDIFGGSACHGANEEMIRHKGFKYFWDQKNFDPISGFAEFGIHFQLTGQRKRKNQFTYDWRMWSLPEIRDLMAEAGFKKTHAYWEGTTRKGTGNGKFKRAEKGEECQAWVAYVAAQAR